MTAEDGPGAPGGPEGGGPGGPGGAGPESPGGPGGGAPESPDAPEAPDVPDAPDWPDGQGAPGEGWLYVLTAPVTKHRDKMLVLEADGVSFAPVFRGREEGEAFLKRLAPPEEYAVQAMHRQDIGEFARAEKVAFLVLDGKGAILGGLEEEGRPAAGGGDLPGEGDPGRG